MKTEPSETEYVCMYVCMYVCNVHFMLMVCVMMLPVRKPRLRDQT